MENNEVPESNKTNLQSEDNTEGNTQENEAGLTEEEKTKLRGDAIGNTVYSQRYVLETLLKLKDNGWNDELEEDMCSIWDMTLDKDVVLFLVDINFVELSLHILKHTKELRLIEVLVGIIGNMCIHEIAAEEVIKGKYFGSLLELIFSDDIPTLIQLFRFFKSLLTCENVDPKLLMTDDVLNQINFILSSSQNTELLEATLEISVEFTSKDKNIFFNYDFLQNIPEAFREIYNNLEDKYLSKEFVKQVTYFLKIIENACALLSEETDKTKMETTIAYFRASNELILPAIDLIIKKCIFLEFMQDETESFEYFMYCSANFLVSFETEPNDNIFETFSDIYLMIIDNNFKDTFETDVCEYIAQYLMYFVENKNQYAVQGVLENRNDVGYKTIFDHMNANFPCSSKFKSIINELRYS